MSEIYIDWDNLPICGEDGVVISPYICIDTTPPPIDVPTAVPLPGTLLLMAAGLVAMRISNRRKK